MTYVIKMDHSPNRVAALENRYPGVVGDPRGPRVGRNLHGAHKSGPDRTSGGKNCDSFSGVLFEHEFDHAKNPCLHVKPRFSTRRPKIGLLVINLRRFSIRCDDFRPTFSFPLSEVSLA